MEILSLQIVRAILLGFISMVVGFFISPYLLGFLKKHQFGTKNTKDEGAPIFTALHKDDNGTPMMAGVLIWGVPILLALVFWLLSKFTNVFAFDVLNFISRQETVLILGVIVLSGILGLADDVLNVFKIGGKKGGLSMGKRLLMCAMLGLVCALWFYFKLDWSSIFVPFKGLVDLGLWFMPFFVFIFLASTFSLNETDGIDGLSSGVSLIALAVFIIIAFVQGRFELAALLMVIGGALVPYLWYNVPTASWFMGDTGSMMLGALFGILAMYTNTALLLPLILCVPFIESLSVIIQVTSKKLRHKKIFKSTPIHHHFEAIGWGEAMVTMRFWLIQAIGAGFGLVLYFLSGLLRLF